MWPASYLKFSASKQFQKVTVKTNKKNIDVLSIHDSSIQPDVEIITIFRLCFMTVTEINSKYHRNHSQVLSTEISSSQDVTVF